MDNLAPTQQQIDRWRFNYERALREVKEYIKNSTPEEIVDTLIHVSFQLDQSTDRIVELMDEVAKLRANP